MPTSYTRKVESGEITTIQAYAERCAAAYLVCMREASTDALPSEVVPNPHYAERLKAAKAKLNGLISLGAKQQVAAWNQHKAQCAANVRAAIEKLVTEEHRYRAMREAVLAWDAPSKFHALKSFMLQQIDVSFDFKREPELTKYARRLYGSKHDTARAWLKAEIESTRREVASAQEAFDREAASAQRQTEFIRDLRACFIDNA